MPSYEINLIKNHLTFREGDDVVLLDTGSPLTLNFSVDQSNAGIAPMQRCVGEGIHEFVSESITELRGMDWISRYAKVLFDYNARRVIFVQEGETLALDNEVASYPCELKFGFPPIVLFNIGGIDRRMYFDTGAVLSFLSADLAQTGVVTNRTVDDFIPGLGAFRTAVYQFPVKIGDDLFDVDFGEAHPLTLVELNMGKVVGVIGYELLARYQVLLDIRGEKFVLGHI